MFHLKHRNFTFNSCYCVYPAERWFNRFLQKALLLVALYPVFSHAQNTLPNDLASQFSRLFNSPDFARSKWSCCVSEVSSGKILCEVNPHSPVIPASNQKLLITAAALLEAGPSYKSRTNFLADGPIANGKLKGNLVVAGYGAVHFTARYPGHASISEKSTGLSTMFDELVERFRRIGIEEIEGNILVDCSEWTDLERNSHYPSASALSFHENTLDIVVKDGLIHHYPERLFGFKIQPERNTDSQKKNTIDGHKTDIISVNSSRDSSDFWRLDQYSPLEYYRNHLRNGLTQRGIKIGGQSIKMHGEINTKYALFSLESLSLGELLKDTGIYSDNFRAETIFLNLGYLVKGKANYKNARRALVTILESNGVKLNRFVPFDGSGLSRKNRISSSDIVKLLNFMLKTEHKDSFIPCLPIAGKTGTLKNKLLKDNLKGRVFAKTGTLNDVTALSGYLIKKSEPELSFSFICNNTPSQKQSWKALKTALDLLATATY